MMLPADLPQLTDIQRRCLRVLSDFPDLAHASRRLHCSQATLRQVLLDVMARLGDRHMHVDGDSVHLLATLKSVMEQALGLCGEANEDLYPDSGTLTGELKMPGSRSAHDPQMAG